MLLGSEDDGHGDEGSEVGDSDSFGSAKSHFVNTNLFLSIPSGLLGVGGGLIHSKDQKGRKRKRKEEEASYMHFGETTGELAERSGNELR